MRFRQSRLKRIREAKEALEREARERARAECKIGTCEKPIEPKRSGFRNHPPGVPRWKDQRNFTDPESKIMKDSTTKGFVHSRPQEQGVSISLCMGDNYTPIALPSRIQPQASFTCPRSAS